MAYGFVFLLEPGIYYTLIFHLGMSSRIRRVTEYAPTRCCQGQLYRVRQTDFQTWKRNAFWLPRMLVALLTNSHRERNSDIEISAKYFFIFQIV